MAKERFLTVSVPIKDSDCTNSIPYASKAALKTAVPVSRDNVNKIYKVSYSIGGDTIVEYYRYIPKIAQNDYTKVVDREFPSLGCPLEILDFTYDATRMGQAPSISAQNVMWYADKDERGNDVTLEDLWSQECHVTFNGENFYLKQIPTSSKSNEDARYRYDLDFVAERVVLETTYLYDVVQPFITSRPISESAVFNFYGDVYELAKRINASLIKSGLATLTRKYVQYPYVDAFVPYLTYEQWNQVNVDYNVLLDTTDVFESDDEAQEFLDEIYNGLNGDYNRYLMDYIYVNTDGVYDLTGYQCKIGKDEKGENITSEEKLISFQKNTIHEALQRVFDDYKLQYYIEKERGANGEFTGNTSIWIADAQHDFADWDANTQDYVRNDDGIPTTQHPLDYGIDDALLSKEKANNTEKIITRITGVGSNENIPWYYPNPTADGWIAPMYKTLGYEQNVIIDYPTSEGSTPSESTLYEKYLKNRIGNNFKFGLVRDSASLYSYTYIDKHPSSSEPGDSNCYEFDCQLSSIYFELLVEQPDDWASNYGNYYVKSHNGLFVHNTSPAFVVEKYYKLCYNFNSLPKLTLEYGMGGSGSNSQNVVIELRDRDNVLIDRFDSNIVYTNPQGFKKMCRDHDGISYYLADSHNKFHFTFKFNVSSFPLSRIVDYEGYLKPADESISSTSQFDYTMDFDEDLEDGTKRHHLYGQPGYITHAYIGANFYQQSDLLPYAVFEDHIGDEVPDSLSGDVFIYHEPICVECGYSIDGTPSGAVACFPRIEGAQYKDLSTSAGMIYRCTESEQPNPRTGNGGDGTNIMQPWEMNPTMGAEEWLRTFLDLKVKMYDSDSWYLGYKAVTLSDYGISIIKVPDIFDSIEFKRVKYITPQPNLMPEVYIKTDGEHRFYDAHNYWDETNNTLYEGVADATIGEVQSGTKVKNPLYKENESDPDNKHYEFENEYIQARPYEHIEDFDDVKPTIAGQTNYIPVNVSQATFNANKSSFYYKDDDEMVQCTELSVYDSGKQYYAILRIDVVDTFGYDQLDNDEIWESSDDGNIQGEYKHPYFFAKLRPLGFNLFDLALQNDMVLSMTTGHCGACNFAIAVDENTNKNPVQLWEYDVYEGTWNGKTLKFYAGDLRRYVDTSNLYYDTDGTPDGYKKVTEFGTLEGSDGWLVDYASTTRIYRRYQYSAEDVEKGLVGNAKNENATHFEGDVVTSGHFIESQQDTTENFVWVALTKDTNTYGTIMPSARPDYSDDNLSVYIRPRGISDVHTGENDYLTDDDNNADKFVLVNIKLPQVYLRRAEHELSRRLIAHMYDNNYQKFNFSANFSRIFLAQNTNMESLLNENSVMYIFFNNRTYRQYAKHYAYKMTHDDVLPEVTVDMNDSLPLSRTFDEQQQVAQFQQSQLFKQQIAASTNNISKQIMARTIGRNSNTIIGGNIISNNTSLVEMGNATRKNQESIGSLRDSMENDYYKREHFVVENGTDLNIGDNVFLSTAYKDGGRMVRRKWNYVTNTFVNDDEQTFAPTFYDSANSQFVYYSDSYELLVTEPADWDDANGKYYELTNGIYVPITWEETFVANTYYKKTEQEQTVTPITSSDLTSALIIQVLGYTPYDAASLDTDVNALINEQVYYVDTIGEANTIHIGESVIHLNDYAKAVDLNSEILRSTSNDNILSSRIETEEGARIAADTTLQSYIDIINGKIPSAASISNQLADKAFVTSAIASATSDFKGSWATWAAVPTDGSLYPVDSEGGNIPKTNDYMVVAQDENHGGATWRYKYSGVWATDGKNGWIAEYMVSDASLTSDQLAALNSGITSTLVAQIGLNQQDIIALDNSKQNIITGAASTVTSNNLNSNLVLISNASGKIAVSTITTTTLAYLSGLTGNVQQQLNALSGTYQPLDADLTAIAALTGTTGFLVKTAADTWELDTNTYVTMSGMQLYLAANYVSQSSLATTLADYVLDTDLAATLDNYALKSSLARVATTGSYTDLKNRPSTFTPSPHTHPWGQITAKPTNIAGYGITDAKIVNGTITLGNQSITPLTSHQSLANYVTTTQLTTALEGYDPMYGTNSGSYSHAIGRGSVASGQYAVATGYNSTASANYAVAMGANAVASSANAWALGSGSVSAGNNAIAMGYDAVALANYTVALGAGTYVMTQYGISNSTTARTNITTETLSSAISNSRTYTTTVASDLSVGMVVLNSTDVKTPLAVITGINRTTNVVTLSVAVTVASGQTLAYRKGNSHLTASYAEGYQTASIGGYGSHAEGRYTTAQGQASHAEGWGTWASVNYQHAVGKWNATGNFAEVVGNGTSETQRSNIRTLDWNGNEWVAGNITAGGYIDATAIKIGGTIINVANAWMQGTSSAANVIWVETSGTDYILHIGNTSITVSATGTATSIAWSGITGVPLTLTSLGNLSGTSNYGFLKLSSANTITVDTTSYALAAHTHTISDITDFPSLAAVATSGSYNDLTNKPDIPTVNDGVLTLQLDNGTLTNTVTFSANSSSNATFSVDLSSYLTSHQTIYALTLSAGEYTGGSTVYNPNTAALSISIPTTSDHISEGNTNLFFTNQRAVNALSTTLSAYMLSADFTETNVYNLLSTARKNALDSGITSAKVTNYDSHLLNSTIHITAAERTAWTAKADAATTLAGYGITDATITDITNGKRITLGNEHVDIDTSGVASLAWSAITGKPDIIAGTNGLASLNNTTTYGLLKYSGTNKIEVDTTSYTTMAAVEAKGYLTSAVTSVNVDASGALGLEFVGNYPITTSGTISLIVSENYFIPTLELRQRWNDAYTAAVQQATPAATGNRLVKRDQYGNFSAGTITANLTGNATTATTATYLGDNNVGTATKPIYLSSGSPTASDATVGSATRPMYMSNGVLTATTYELKKTVPSDAKFTDTTYSAGTGLKLTSTTFAVDYGTIASGNNKPVSGGAIYTKLADYALISNLATVATSGSYNDLLNKPAINDGTLTLKVNGEIVTTFSANSSENVEFNVNTSGGGGGGGTGTVTRVAMTVPTGFTINGSPITSEGILELGYANGYALPSQDDRNYWNSAYNDTLAATKNNTPSTIVKRDANGNFEAGTITANLTGTASEATKLGHTTVGSGVKFIYLDRGEAKASASSLGGANQPIWLDNGQLKQCNTFAPASHYQAWSTITDTPTTLALYGITDAYTKAQSDARYAPASHLQAWSTITDTPTTLAGYGLQDDAYTKTQANNVFAYKLHTHTVSDITDFPTLADVATSGLYSDLDGIPETFAPSAHSHNWSDILPASRPTTLAGYGLQDDAYITPEQDGYVTIRLGENSVVIDTSGTVSSVDWVAINNKPPIIAGPNGLASLSGTTTYGILKLTDTNKIEVDTTNYANQNAWSSVKIGNTTVAAGTTTDTLTLVAGSNVTLTPNATNKSITLAATDTTYDEATQLVHGLMSTADKIKLDGIAAGANNYSLPTASDNTLGGVKTNYTPTLDKYYAVKVDASGNMYVNVPWSGGTYELPVAGDDTLGGVKTGYSMPSTPSNRNYAVDLDVNDKMFVEVPWENTTYDEATQLVHGLMSTADKTKLDGIAAGANNYSLPTASASTLGGVKIGYTDNDKNYRVQLDNNNRMFVNVDWQNTEYTLPEATSLALGGVKIGYVSQNNQDYPVQLDTNGKMFVSVPWTDTPYSLPLATGETRGGVKIGYTTDQSQRKYAVQLDNEKMYVNVPWENTTYQAATASTLGLVKIGYTEPSQQNNRTYAVQLTPSNQMFVSVPWTDTNTTYSAGTGLTLNNNTFAVDFGTITNGGTKAVTGGVIYSQLTTKTDFLPLNPDCLVIAHDMHTVKSSNFVPVTSSTTWNPNNDNYLPTMKGISAYVTGLTGNFAKYSTALTTGRLVAAAGSDTITSTNFIAAASSETWDINSDNYLPTMKGISNYVTGYVPTYVQNYCTQQGFTSNAGTVTSIEIKAGAGIGVSPTGAITTSGTVTITNTGVRSITESAENGKIRVLTGNTYANIPVHGLGTAAYQSASSFAAYSHTQAWSTITNTPTNLADYGIVDAYTKNETYSINEIDTNFYDKTEIDAMLANLGVMTFQGSVPTYSDLPADASSGDVYVVEATGTPYVWDGTQWVALTLVDLSGYVTQSQIANMVTTYGQTYLPQGQLVMGYDGTRKVAPAGKTILDSYSGTTDFTGLGAAIVVPTASVINSYLSAAYQPKGSYVTEEALQAALSSYVTDSDLSQALSGYVTLTYLETYYVTQAALSQTLEDYVTDSDLSQALSGYVQNSQITNMVTSTANLPTNRIVLGNSNKVVKDSGVQILRTGSWSGTTDYVPTTSMTDGRYAVRNSLNSGYLVTASSSTTVTANTYQPLTSTGLWSNSDGYIPTAARISSYITSLIGSTLQGYDEELTLLAAVDKNTNQTGYMYWNGSSYELADVQGGGDGNVSASNPLTNNCIVLGAGGYNIQPSTAQIVSSTQGWGETNGNVATIGGICNYLSDNYQPLNTNLTGISNLSSSGSGYLYYNGTAWSFNTPSGTGNVTAASTLTNGKLVTGAGDFGIATNNYEVATYSEIATTWDNTSNVYVPTMASIHHRLYDLANIRFRSGTYDGGDNNYYYPNGSSLTIKIPTNTSHLTNDSNFVTQSWVAGNYQPKDADLTAIAALSGTSGFLKKTAANTWTLDTSSYQPLDADLTKIAEATLSTGYLYYNGTSFEYAAGLSGDYLPLAGGTMTGTIVSQDIIPASPSVYNLGTPQNSFKDVCAVNIRTQHIGAGFSDKISFNVNFGSSVSMVLGKWGMEESMALWVDCDIRSVSNNKLGNGSYPFKCLYLKGDDNNVYKIYINSNSTFRVEQV